MKNLGLHIIAIPSPLIMYLACILQLTADCEDWLTKCFIHCLISMVC